ncbi:uncharacterized protein ASPGLDRAFT_434648 [Aspergillus glaucus CBS 516.65]|uniref:Uncharacterized protein n=1 Tax=Aspergillus glaucus CBS 516.65 TaxID=1160497 RepID=A0A1L9VG91_ASPGL|nr:hypothetical protein ASPGLDRAFT_434648 [Aspergillus glaucus CBS 516.65]OJJ82929.1 hypothetical protein ASPGLDRAFT_434648 [Aspergillus glaucus CBS 516.65]
MSLGASNMSFIHDQNERDFEWGDKSPVIPSPPSYSLSTYSPPSYSSLPPILEAAETPALTPSQPAQASTSTPSRPKRSQRRFKPRRCPCYFHAESCVKLFWLTVVIIVIVGFIVGFILGLVDYFAPGTLAL